MLQATKAKLEARDDWAEVKSGHDVVSLLKALKSLLHNQLQNDCHAGITAYESVRSLFQALIKARRNGGVSVTLHRSYRSA